MIVHNIPVIPSFIQLTIMDSSTAAIADHQLLDSLKSGDFQTAFQLLPKDGPLITIGPEGFTPLHYACRHGEAEVARLLITQ